MANKSILDAKIKKHKSKHPQKSKPWHVPAKIHVPKEKHFIQIKEKVKTPQRQKLQKSKIIWIPKMLIKEMHLKEKSQLASIHATQKASSIHPLSKSPYINPSSPQSPLSPYASYPKFPILHLPTLLVVLIFFFLHFLLNLIQYHLSRYFITSQGVCQWWSFQFPHLFTHRSYVFTSLIYPLPPTI